MSPIPQTPNSTTTTIPFPPGPASRALGRVLEESEPASFGADALRAALERVSEPVHVIERGGELGVVRGGTVLHADAEHGDRVVAYVPPAHPAMLGDPTFREDLGIRLPMVAGAMANGIASEEIVIAMGRAGMIGFFGAAGLPPARVEAAIHRIQSALGARTAGALPYGFNLIHSPNEPALEAGVVDLYLEHGVRVVDAAAYLDLSLPLIRYRLHGIHRDPATGRVVAPNRVIGKVSRIEVARRFFSPAPEKFVRKLVESGELTAEQASLAAEIPVANDITAEADSGGHTDNQPFVILIPTLLALRDELEEKYLRAGHDVRLRVGAAGGIGTPHSMAAAFASGAAYALTGSVNQSCLEAGTSDRVREMLCGARQADVAMAPAADMFEMGVKVQVLKRGTMFAMRAARLYEIYRAHASWEEVPAATRASLEKDLFRASFDEIWTGTRRFFEERDPTQIARAETDPKHRMALVFRWYLGLSSIWAKQGDPARQADYQIWCGPAMGAFNEWVKGSMLEPAAARDVVTVSLNLLFGGAYLTRVASLRVQGVRVSGLDRVTPRPRAEIEALLA